MFAARRKPKRVVPNDIREHGSTHQDEDTGPVVRRPNAAPKTKSKLRISQDPGPESTPDGQSTEPSTSAKTSRLPASSLSRSERDRDHVERPSYSKSYLDELKGSTPSTPRDISLYNSSLEGEEGEDLPTQTRALDIASKFGTVSAKPSAIPSAAEIQEKKDRRLRLAREQQADALGNPSRKGGSINNQDDFISLDAYDSDGEFKPSRLQVSSHLHNDRLANTQEYTRLIPEDEDIAEGFESFIDDDHEKTAKSGRILMGMKTTNANDRQTIRHLIDSAEGLHPTASDSDDPSNDSTDADSDTSASHAYIAAQTSHGTSFSHLTREQRRRHEKDLARPRAPDKTTPVPTLAAGLSRLRELQTSAEMNRQRAEMRKAEIRTRLAEVEAEKGRIQTALEELGSQLERTNQAISAQNGNANAGVNAGSGVHGDGDDDGERAVDGSRAHIRQSGLEDIRGLGLTS